MYQPIESRRGRRSEGENIQERATSEEINHSKLQLHPSLHKSREEKQVEDCLHSRYHYHSLSYHQVHQEIEDFIITPFCTPCFFSYPFTTIPPARFHSSFPYDTPHHYNSYKDQLDKAQKGREKKRHRHTQNKRTRRTLFLALTVSVFDLFILLTIDSQHQNSSIYLIPPPPPLLSSIYLSIHLFASVHLPLLSIHE